MARRSLKPQLNQIRAWVRQGRTDAWIAHQLEVSASELREFRKQHGFTPDEEDAASQDVDLRDEIEAEIEAATAEEAARKRKRSSRAARRLRRRARWRGRCRRGRRRLEDAESGEGERPARRRRRRGRRGRGRRKDLEATFDHGEKDGYGLWLDPAVKDNPVSPSTGRDSARSRYASIPTRSSFAASPPSRQARTKTTRTERRAGPVTARSVRPRCGPSEPENQSRASWRPPAKSSAPRR